MAYAYNPSTQEGEANLGYIVPFCPQTNKVFNLKLHAILVLWSHIVLKFSVSTMPKEQVLNR